jgi:putative membrane protein
VPRGRAGESERSGALCIGAGRRYLEGVRGFLLRMAISALGLWLAQRFVRGMAIEGTETLIAAALLLGIANAVVRPILIFLTFPITVVTLGLFLLVINAAMLGLVASLLRGFTLTGFGPALVGSIIVSLTGWLASWTIGPTGRFEILIVKRRG